MSTSLAGLLWFGWEDNAIILKINISEPSPIAKTYLLLEPLDRFIASNTVGSSNAASAASALGDTAAIAVQDDVEVHTIDTDGRIVFQSKIDVFLNTESEVAGVREVFTVQFVFFHLKICSFRYVPSEMGSIQVQIRPEDIP